MCMKYLDVALSLISPPRYSIQHQARLEGWGWGREGVATVYKNTLEAVWLSALAIPGMEALHVFLGTRDGFGIVLVYHAPCSPCHGWIAT